VVDVAGIGHFGLWPSENRRPMIQVMFDYADDATTPHPTRLKTNAMLVC